MLHRKCSQGPRATQCRGFLREDAKWAQAKDVSADYVESIMVNTRLELVKIIVIQEASSRELVTQRSDSREEAE